MNQAGLIQSWAINHAHSILWVGVIDGLLLVMADLDVGSRPEHDASCVSGLFGISQLKETLMCLPRTSLRQTHILHVFPVVSHWLGTSAFLLIQWLSKPICVSAPGTYLTALRALRPPYVFTWSLLFKCCHLVFQLSYPLLHWRKGRSSYSLSCFFLLHLWHRRKKGNIIFTVLSFFHIFLSDCKRRREGMWPLWWWINMFSLQCLLLSLIFFFLLENIHAVFQRTMWHVVAVIIIFQPRITTAVTASTRKCLPLISVIRGLLLSPR